ncbi:MAG: cytochrome c [Deltaproteobacteria bacterium]|nr:cytochrome c [Deltaproteobacteria bacterium]
MKKVGIFLVLSVAALAACSGEKPAAPAEATATAPAPPAAAPAPEAPAAPAVAAADPKAEAEQVFTQRCVTCHGAGGNGDGVAAAALNPKPRAYSDATWQGETTDEVIAKVIVEGGAAIGKSPMMPPNPDLAAKPEVVKALVAKIRSFKAK